MNHHELKDLLAKADFKKPKNQLTGLRIIRILDKQLYNQICKYVLSETIKDYHKSVFGGDYLEYFNLNGRLRYICQTVGFCTLRYLPCFSYDSMYRSICLDTIAGLIDHISKKNSINLAQYKALYNFLISDEIELRRMDVCCVTKPHPIKSQSRANKICKSYIVEVMKEPGYISTANQLSCNKLFLLEFSSVEEFIKKFKNVIRHTQEIETNWFDNCLDDLEFIGNNFH